MKRLRAVPIRRHPRLVAERQGCLAVLRDAAERARSGEIEAVAVVMVTRDGRALIQRTDLRHVDAALGGLARLQRDILDMAADVETP